MQRRDSAQGGSPFSVGRPLTIDDLFRVQHVRNPVFSPNGRWLAFEVTRPVAEERVRRLTYFDQIHCDVWLAPAAGGEPRNLTCGAESGDGFWNPLWSPGGRRLAMLHLYDGRVRTRVWDAATDTLTSLPDLAIKHQYWLDGLAWLSDRQLAAITWPPGSSEPCRIRVATRLGESPARRWPLAWSGAACTATVLVSGDGPWPTTREAAHAQLCMADIEDGSRQLIDEGNLHSLTVSPDGRFLAYFKATPEVPRMQPDRPSPGMFEWAEYHLHVAGPEMPPRRVAAVQHPDMSTLAWAPSSEQLALLQRPAAEGAEPRPPAVLRVSVPDGTCELLARDEMMLHRFAWTADDRLLVSAQPAPGAADAASGGRADWWLVGDDGGWRDLTAGMEAVPERLVSAGSALIGVAGGHVWRIGRDGQPAVVLPTDPAGEIAAVGWIGPAASRESCQAMLIISLQQPEGERLLLGRCGEDAVLRLEPLPQLSAAISTSWLGGEAALKAAEAQGVLLFPDGQTTPSPDGEAVAFAAEDRNGHFLWLVKPGSPEPPPPLVALNTWTAQIAEPQARELTYRGIDGQELKALLLLPDDHKEGRRCPLITSVYPEAMKRWRLITAFTLPFPHVPQLLTAHGYAVLYPSMPMPQGACDPYHEMVKGVMPAVDRAIELGIADPERLGLFGHSGGGWAVYSLVTQTTRFRAAVASAGLTDLASAYGTFDANYRYGDLDQPYTAITYWSKFWERGYGRMGGPPWVEAARYQRNSPMSHAHRVQTPLLMIHGDWDGVPSTQAEQFFTALYRQGKPACLLRYDGEEHLIEGEPNVRDMWERIYAWFDYYFSNRPTVSPARSA